MSTSTALGLHLSPPIHPIPTTAQRMLSDSKLKQTEAVSFIDNVQSQFENDPQKYERFLGIMRDLKKDTISPGEVLLQIAALFKGYPDLAREFNTFLPPGYLLAPRGEKASHILLNTPEGTTVWPGDSVKQRGRARAR